MKPKESFYVLLHNIIAVNESLQKRPEINHPIKRDAEACERFFNCHGSSAYSVIYIDMQRFGVWPGGREENKPK